MSKSTALVIGLSIIAVFGGLAFIVPNNAAHLGTILWAIVSLVGAYIGLQVVNNGVKGHFFNPELYDVENKEININGGEK